MSLLGTGSMAAYQRAKFAAMEGVEVSACYDADGTRAEAFAQAHGIPLAFDTIDALLASAPDAVACCLVDSLHFEAGRTVLGAGVPLLCEKPLADTLDRARELAALARDPQALAMVNLSKRNAPALAALGAVLADGSLGAVQSIEADYRQGWVVTKVWGDWRHTPRWKWRLQPAFCTAGVLGDLGVHLMDALIVLFGVPQEVRPVVRRNLVSAMDAGLVDRVELDTSFHGTPGRPAWVDVEAEVRFAAAPCRFRLSWIDRGALDSFRIRVVGKRATALLDLERSRTSVMVTSGDGEREVDGPVVESTYHSFIAAVREGRARHPDTADALAAQEALEPLAVGAE